MDPLVLQEFLHSVIGDYTLGRWLAYFFFALVGMILHSWNEEHIQVRRTKFRLSRFLKKNVKHFIFTILLIYVQFRFFEDLTGTTITEYSAFLMGFTANGISALSNKAIKK